MASDGRVAVELLGTGVPAGDQTRQIVADDRVLRSLDDRCQQPAGLFVLLALGDVDEGDHGTIDDVVQVTIRPDLHQVAGATLGHRHLALDGDQATQHLLHVLPQPVAGQMA